MTLRLPLKFCLVACLLVSSTPVAMAQSAAALQLRAGSSLGQFLADGSGMTLYVLKTDPPGQSGCVGACAVNWPPVQGSSNADLPAGISGQLSSIQRADGSQQLAYNRMPLYRFAGDKNPGDANGQGIGGVWFVADVANNAAAPSSGGPGCQFVLGFKTLHDLDAADIGDCTDNQTFAANGDAQQHTTKGLMAWRKADNWTAFTNGYMTWINGPNGLVSRLNTDRFPWEAPAPSPAVAPPSAAATPASSPASAPASYDPTIDLSGGGGY